MYIYFADTETTGVPISYKAPITDANNWPRITQMSGEVWQFPDRKNKKEVNNYIYPDGWELPKDPWFKDHGFTMKKLQEEGKPILDILEEQVYILNNVDLVVFHNAKFDWLIMLSEFHRNGLQLKRRPVVFDTMEKSRGITRIPNPKSHGWKAPTLEELYKHFFKRNMIGAHNSMFDVVATRQIFFRMVDIKILDPVKYINYERAKLEKLSGTAPRDEAEGKEDSGGTKNRGPEQGKLF